MIKKELIEIIKSKESFDFNETFDFYKTCGQLDIDNELHAQSVLIHVLNNKSKFDRRLDLVLSDLVEAVGFYPYIDKEDELILESTDAQIRKHYHHSKNLRKTFHRDQHHLLALLENNKNIIVSAPTSFGKSLLIEELIAKGDFQNIVIIQPTLALLNETRQKLSKYNSTYKLIVRTSQEPSTELNNIFLFTAERVNEYSNFPRIDFLVIDEFYKLSGRRDDERSSSLNNAFHYLLKYHNPKFYLLGPNIDGISEGFAEKYNAIFYRTEYSLVESNSIDLYKDYEDEFGKRGKKAQKKEEVLFDLLLNLNNEQSIIYCSSPNRVRSLSKKFYSFLEDIEYNTTPEEELELTDWIKEYVSKEWSLLNCLKYKIGIHDGALQKHITSSIIDYFNEGKLKYLFCTSTIIEGVNTSAKNIIFFDSNKGPSEVDFFDYSNIKGRAGRLMEHYVGNIYNFNKPPSKSQVIIDIPFFQQDPIRDEVLIQLDPSEIIYPDSDQNISINNIPSDEKEIIKNNGVKVFGQKSIFDILRRDIDSKYELINWNQPKYNQLTYILGLAWDHLIVEGETTRPMTKNKLVHMTFNYGLHQNIEFLIKSNYSYLLSLKQYAKKSEADAMDDAIQNTFHVMKHWFQYKVPKWLSVMNEIQKFVCQEKGLRSGNYIFYANKIENDFLRENLSILYEYGIPSSAIRKLEYSIPEEINQDEVLKMIRDRELYNNERLLQYEKLKLLKNIMWSNNR